MKKITEIRIVWQFLSFVRSCLNIYPYHIEHEAEGYYKYDKPRFEAERPHLLKTLKRMQRAGINPNIDDSIFGYDNSYFIKSICYYRSHCAFWVDENQHRENEA